jgi:hypothetical protein
MGQRISFFMNNYRKQLKDLVFENFFAFRIWYFEYYNEANYEPNENFGNEELKNYLIQGTDFKVDYNSLDRQLIDELIAEFIVGYCDTTDREGKILEFLGAPINKWRYEGSTEMVLQTTDKDFITLWNFIIFGRSLKDNVEFNSYSNDFKIGFLTFDEHRILKLKIEFHFGNIEQIRQTYWTDQEKLKEQNAIKNSKNRTYSLVEHNPKSSGLEYVLQVLNQISNNKNELITAIE